MLVVLEKEAIPQKKTGKPVKEWEMMSVEKVWMKAKIRQLYYKGACKNQHEEGKHIISVFGNLLGIEIGEH